MNTKPVPREAATRPAPCARALSALAAGAGGAPGPAAGVRAPLTTLSYAPAPECVDANLLILFHGLGDTNASFSCLGTTLQKTLPQTAVLSVQAPLRVPLLDEAAWMWWPSFDSLGDLIAHPDPRDAIAAVCALLDYLTAPEAHGGCAWRAANVHLFGFGQGGSLALEATVARSRRRAADGALGSVTSLPTFLPPLSVPVCFVTRFPAAYEVSSATARSQVAAVRKAFAHVTLLNFPPRGAVPEESMLHGSEWQDVFRFWAKFWRHRSTWERDGEVYEVG
ncbi:hypothetical protein MSPP1_001786 [Malassezia sp. CBS 17886]|nr:hypothetical protein MSPP1_001786 [Malassezia sp. CBS 17886]